MSCIRKSLMPVLLQAVANDFFTSPIRSPRLLANNHFLDWGYEAAFDCLALCKDVGVAAVGIGRNIKAARQPVIVERNGTTFGFLAYCSIGPAGYEATAERPGHAPMRAHTHYEQWNPQPGTPPLIHTFAHKEDLREMVDDISRLRKQVDVVVVGFHWGVHYITELIADYEYEVGHAAIDAGADLILGNHPHLPKGIEVYKGKVIFHAMNDLATHGGWRPPATQPENSMSKETLDQFIQKVTDSEQLQSRIGEEIDADSLIALGAEHGCDFSAEELQESAELSDEELDGVAGGLAQAGGAPNFRIVPGRNSSADHPDGPGRKLVCDGSST